MVSTFGANLVPFGLKLELNTKDAKFLTKGTTGTTGRRRRRSYADQRNDAR